MQARTIVLASPVAPNVVQENGAVCLELCQGNGPNDPFTAAEFPRARADALAWRLLRMWIAHERAENGPEEGDEGVDPNRIFETVDAHLEALEADQYDDAIIPFEDGSALLLLADVGSFWIDHGEMLDAHSNLVLASGIVAKLVRDRGNEWQA